MNFCGGFGGQLIGYRIGELKPINIAHYVRRFLMGGRTINPATTIELPSPQFIIAGWDGARDDILMPLLKEIRANAERALQSLPFEQQSYRVSLKIGEGEDSGFGVLTVSNAYQVQMSDDPFSTKRGRATVQRLSSLFWCGSCRGYAVDTREEADSGRALYTWRIYFPLWESQIEEELNSGL